MKKPENKLKKYVNELEKARLEIEDSIKYVLERDGLISLKNLKAQVDEYKKKKEISEKNLTILKGLQEKISHKKPKEVIEMEKQFLIAVIGNADICIKNLNVFN